MKLTIEECKKLLEEALNKKEIYNVDINEIKLNISNNFEKTFKEYKRSLLSEDYEHIFNRGEVFHIRTKYMTIKGPKELYNRYSKKNYENEFNYLKDWINENLPICELFLKVKKECKIIKGKKIDPNKVNETKKYKYSEESGEFTEQIFKEISAPIYGYLKDMFRKQYIGICNLFEESGYKDSYEFFKATPALFRDYYYSVIREFYNDDGQKIRNFESKLNKLSEQKAQRIIDNYVNKNVDKIAYILDNKSLDNYTVSELEYQTGKIISDMNFSFNDGTSFSYLTSIRYNTSKYGTDFLQYPARFYDVVCDCDMEKPSEEKMKTVFLENKNILKI